MSRGYWKFACGLLAYWLILLLASFQIVTFPGERLLMPLLLAVAPPLVLLAARSLWQHARSDLNRLAYRDELTGLANRRAFGLYTRQRLRRAAPGSLALILLDIDGLKAINDACGHQAGDELLLNAAAAFASLPGEAFRLGGDEFAIVLDRSRGESVTSVLRSIRPLRLRFKSCGHDHDVRASLGVASNAAGGSFESLFREADARMAEFKRRPADDAAAARPAAETASAEQQEPSPPPALAPVLSLEERRRRGA